MLVKSYPEASFDLSIETVVISVSIDVEHFPVSESENVIKIFAEFLIERDFWENAESLHHVINSEILKN